MGEAIMVGMGDLKFARALDDVLIAPSLGSCIAVCAYEPRTGITAMAHIALPDSCGSGHGTGRFADTAVPALLEAIEAQGAARAAVRIAIVGGAQLFAFSGSGIRLEIGPRNCSAVRAALESAKIEVVASDLGGSAGRAVELSADGTMRISVIGRSECEIVSLGQLNTSAVDYEVAAPVS